MTVQHVQSFSGKAVVAGVGQTELTRASGRTVLDQAVEAIRLATADADLAVDDVDGILTYHMNDSVPAPIIAKSLGLERLRWHNDIAGGGTQCASILLDAAMAIEAGLAESIVVVRAMNGRSGKRMGQVALALPDAIEEQFTVPYGLLGPVHQFALACARFLHDRDMTSTDLGRVAVQLRRNATANPRAIMRDEITLDDYFASPIMATPLRRLDCCQETDGACALVVTSAARGHPAARPPVAIHAGVRGGGLGATAMDRADDTTAIFSRFIAEPLLAAAGMTLSDVDVALLYDAYTFLVLEQLEDFGFCGRGEAGEYVAAGGIAPCGTTPVNPHGGLLSEGYVHGLNNVLEAVRQLRGDGVNQVPDAAVALCTGFGGGYGSGLVLTTQP
jgi:acetyl-CoA acetyltransferase